MTKIMNIVLCILMMIILIFFYRYSFGGADFEQYRMWAASFAHNDISFIVSNILSPKNVPFSCWSFGPGLIFSLGCFFRSDSTAGALLIGWLFNLIFWGAYLGILQFLTKDKYLVLFGLLITFLGSHVGYHSFFYASESLSYTCLAVIIYWNLTKPSYKIIDYLLTGIWASLLIMVRGQLIIYLIPIYGIVYYRLITSFKSAQLTTNRLILAILLCHIPIIFGVASNLIVNQWMTGSPLISPYIFGAGEFKSLDFSDPELLAVLIHPWHGLLSYHPLHAVGLLSIILLSYKIKDLSQRIIIIVTILVIILHFYIQASWYGWWMGLGTFGARGLGIYAIIFMPALLYFMSIMQHEEKSIALLLSLITVLCGWSCLLLMQGTTQFYTYHQLFMSQVNMIISLYSFNTLIFISLIVISIIIARKIDASANSFLFLCVVFLLSCMCYKIIVVPKHIILTYALGVTLPFAVIATCKSDMLDSMLSYYDKIMMYFTIIFFTLIVIIFTRFATETEKRISRGKIPEIRTEYVGSVPIGALMMTYNEYLKVPGFDEKKMKLNNYIQELLSRTKRISQ